MDARACVGVSIPDCARRNVILVLSVDGFNARFAGLMTVVPTASESRLMRTRIEVSQLEGGLAVVSYFTGEQTRTLAVR